MGDPYGPHLRRVIAALHALPTSEHRHACRCKKCVLGRPIDSDAPVGRSGESRVSPAAEVKR